MDNIATMSAQELKAKAQKLIDAKELNGFRYIGSSNNFDEMYTLHDKLGEGNYGEVFLAKHNGTGIECAIKVIDKNKIE